MSPEQTAFFNQVRLPARLNSEQVGWLLGFSPYDVTVLTSKGFLKPLGKPAQNSTKFYCTKQILTENDDLKWLERATLFLNKHWKDKNSKRKKGEIAAIN